MGLEGGKVGRMATYGGQHMGLGVERTRARVCQEVKFAIEMNDSHLVGVVGISSG